MYRHHPLLRKILLLMLVPLILFNGRVSAGCICMDGHFKLFCDGNGCCSADAGRFESNHEACGDCCNHRHSSPTQSCCNDWRNQGVESAIDTHNSQCTSSNGCHKLSLLPVKLTEKESVTVANEIVVLDYVFYSERSLSIAVSALPHTTIFLPPRERQKLLQRFVI